MVLSRIPTKALYKLQVSVAQEVQSRVRTDAVELQEMKGEKESLELMIEQVKFDTRGEKERTDKIEQRVTTIYNHLPDNVHAESSSTEEKLKMIAQTIDHYRKQIEDLKEKLTPTTPPEVREKRKEEVALQLVELEKQANTTT
jgi:predicted  nucleic acid-binding Zn-ribbon protein